MKTKTRELPAPVNSDEPPAATLFVRHANALARLVDFVHEHFDTYKHLLSETSVDRSITDEINSTLMKLHDLADSLSSGASLAECLGATDELYRENMEGARECVPFRPPSELRTIIEMWNRKP